MYLNKVDIICSPCGYTWMDSVHVIATWSHMYPMWLSHVLHVITCDSHMYTRWLSHVKHLCLCVPTCTSCSDVTPLWDSFLVTPKLPFMLWSLSSWLARCGIACLRHSITPNNIWTFLSSLTGTTNTAGGMRCAKYQPCRCRNFFMKITYPVLYSAFPILTKALYI